MTDYYLTSKPVGRRFAKFWEEYPKKIGKGDAWRSWVRLQPDDDLLAEILKALAWQKPSPKWSEGYIPNPGTYLNQRRWEDEPEAPIAGHGELDPSNPKSVLFTGTWDQPQNPEDQWMVPKDKFSGEGDDQ